MPDSEVEPAPYESTDRTIYRRPWHPTFHDLRSPGKRGLCTVAGVESPHPARWSIRVRQQNGEQVWYAACDDYVPPPAEGGD
jgi:hypothetical protein